ncbi:MAG: hypothetical protein AAF108_03695 [Planctomycetota bacterium]
MASQKFPVALLACVLAPAASAQQITFSFASDSDSNDPTFVGSSDTFGNAPSAEPDFSLLVDDGNGPLPTLEFADLLFMADFSITSFGKTMIAPGLFLHNYSVDGVFALSDAGSNNILEADVAGGVMSIVGGENSWATSGSIITSDIDMSEITYRWGGMDFPDYLIFNGQESAGDDLDDGVFTLTFLADSSSDGVVELDDNGLPVEEWTAEASFSGSTRSLIPTPGAVAMIGLGGLLGAVRRR